MPLALIAPLAVSALTAAQADLLASARAGPLYVSSAAQRTDLARRVDAAVSSAESAPAWPRDRDLLCRDWELVATTNAAVAGPLLPRMDADPAALGAVAVSQRWSDEAPGGMRCSNVVTISRPEPTWTSAWTLLPVGGESSLRLQHSATIVSPEAPLTVAIALEKIVLDANRRAGEPVEEIVALPTPPLPRAITEAAGTVEVLLLTDALGVTRERASDGRGAPALRIFARRDDGGASARAAPAVTTTAPSPSWRAGVPTMLASPRRRAPGKAQRRGSASRSNAPAKPAKEGGKLDARLAASVYYGAYTLFFGKLLLALIDRFVGSS